LKRFPGAYCDASGYVIFETEADYRNCPELRITKDVNLPNGIAAISGYVRVEKSKRIKSGANASKGVKKTRATRAPRQFSEGAIKEMIVELHYRDPKLKKEAIKRRGGTSGAVCRFSFGDSYGDLGDGYIELHHLEPISLGERRSMVEDVALVCANCHRMLHRHGAEPMGIEELRDIVESINPPAGEDDESDE
jgi:predicted HNH restriction endonuclease